ncbi:MAG: class I SAM-dependent methyltransferase [Crocosphaera sp.]|nr:class I SAM-dependent methyltransferase [Crocosphaera sp.]
MNLKNLIRQIPGSKKLAQALGLTTMTKSIPGGRNFLVEMLPKQSIGAEIGVDTGNFSEKIINSIAPKELHLIDPWEYQVSDTYINARYGGKAKEGQKTMDERYLGVCDRFCSQIQSGQVQVHRGYSTDILEQFPDEYFDWIYIDGNHLYEYVLKDLELSFKKTKSGGFITGDDYRSGGWWKGGVKQAVDEFRKRRDIKLVEICNGQFVFRKA